MVESMPQKGCATCEHKIKIHVYGDKNHSLMEDPYQTSNLTNVVGYKIYPHLNRTHGQKSINNTGFILINNTEREVHNTIENIKHSNFSSNISEHNNASEIKKRSVDIDIDNDHFHFARDNDEINIGTIEGPKTNLGSNLM